jgi:hypothetical protein
MPVNTHTAQIKTGPGTWKKRFIHKHTVIYGEHADTKTMQCNAHDEQCTHPAGKNLQECYRVSRPAGSVNGGYLNPPSGPKKKAEK